MDIKLRTGSTKKMIPPGFSLRSTHGVFLSLFTLNNAKNVLMFTSQAKFKFACFNFFFIHREYHSW